MVWNGWTESAFYAAYGVSGKLNLLGFYGCFGVPCLLGGTPFIENMNMSDAVFTDKTTLLARMTVGTDEHIHPQAQFVCTENGYWVAWHQGLAAVLPPDRAADEPCDWVEGMDSLADLIAFIEGGEYAEIEEFDGDDAAWAAACTDHDHDHEPDEG